MPESPPSAPFAVQAASLLDLARGLVAELHPHRLDTDVSLDSRLEADLGFDSVSRIELLARIEERLGVRLAEEAIATAETLRDLLRGVEAALSSPSTLVRPPSMAATREAATAGRTAVLPDRAATLLDVLEWHAQAQPERPHVLLYEDGAEPRALTYRSLFAAAEEVAAGLQGRGLKPGDRVAIMLPTGLDYFYGFFGVLLCGGIPVPIYPPARPNQLEEHLRRYARVLNNAQVRMLITLSEAMTAARLMTMLVESLAAPVSVPELRRGGTLAGRPALRAQDIAYLQYTSGSTGDPKGVTLTHANLLANVRAMGAALQVGPADVIVSWLPLYHDMGLIGAWLGSLYFAAPLVLMSPQQFLARPERWLWAIQRHRGTISGGPNFGYELCLRHVPDRRIEGLDLSSWRIAFNGAEPVMPETLQRFAERFRRFGLRPEALMPVYGLAENGVGLAFPPIGRGPLVDRVQRKPLMAAGRAIPAAPDDAQALRIPACGMPLPGHEIRVVNEAGVELGEREEGRVQFRGPSATSGYFRNPDATRRLFEDGWLDTGDLGYIAAGEVYVTGRRKDIIIRAGRNVYPHELEDAIGELPEIRKNCVAVFGSRDPKTGTERVIALAETREKDPAALARLRTAIDAKALALLEQPLDDIVLVPPHTVLKTSSGKIRRAASRELYERGLGPARRRALWLQVARLVLAGLAPQLRRIGRRSADIAYGLYGIALLAMLAPPVGIAVAFLPRPIWAWGVLRGAARLVLALLGARVRVHGLEHLPRASPHVLMVNHSSYLDGLVIAAALPGAWRFPAKREFTRNPVTRVFLSHLGAEFVERFDVRRSLEDFRRLGEAAGRGLPWLYFPEGTFSRMPGLLPFFMGGFLMAAEQRLPVVPVIVRGARSMLRDGQWLVRRGSLSLTVCPPLRPAGRDWKAAVDLRDRTRAQLLALVGEPDLAKETGVLAALAARAAPEERTPHTASS